MIWLKAIVLPLLLWLSALLAVAMEHSWRDRRTKKHKRARNIAVVVATLVAVVTGAVMWNEIAQSQRLAASVAHLELKVQDEADRAEARDEVAMRDRSQMLDQMDALDGQLKPFVELARRSYPTSSDADALAKLREEIEIVHARASKIEEMATPRRLTPGQEARVVAVLQEGPTATVEVQYDPTDAEAADYGRQLVSVLRSGGWTVIEFRLVALGPSPGLHILYRDEQRSIEIGRRLHQALAAVQVTPIGRLTDAQDDWDVKLYVGPKPVE